MTKRIERKPCRMCPRILEGMRRVYCGDECANKFERLRQCEMRRQRSSKRLRGLGCRACGATLDGKRWVYCGDECALTGARFRRLKAKDLAQDPAHLLGVMARLRPAPRLLGLDADDLEADVSMSAVGKPERRGDCASVKRPCPFVSCKYNLFLDITKGGRLRLAHRGRKPHQMAPAGSCALDVAETGPKTLEYVGDLLGVSRERIRQIEVDAMKKIREESGWLVQTLLGHEWWEDAAA